MNRSKDMCNSRGARSLSNTKLAWWYINPRSIDIIAVGPDNDTTQVRLTRKQLERAIEIMDAALKVIE